MANNYQQFSVILLLNSNEEKEWFQRNLNEDKLPDSKETKLMVEICGDDCGYLFSYKVEDNDDEGQIWFYSEEYGDPYQLACLVHCFFKDMRPNGSDKFAISYAFTCSKMRVDEFGGGMQVATKKGVGGCGYDDQYDYALSGLLNPFESTEE
ncbi:MAG TPA: hypothetical protein VMX17_10370 [Candidatus Glassbacteria bacterium]|nr:hypothetical protein [Candidatus Glassbacteria bacterium]